MFNWNFRAVFLVLLPAVLAIEWPPSAEICQDVVCTKPRGSWCTTQVKKGEERAVCACPEDCADDLQPVCSVYGRQFDNLCKLHLYTCKKRKNIPMAYEGECIASQKKCKQDEFQQFPVRLLDWFMHLQQIDEFGRLDPNTNIKQVTTEARAMYATWKFNLLDTRNDGYLDKRDLQNFRYALMPLEHCANDFFKSCADRKSKKISLEGWIQCLKVYDAEEYPQVEAELEELEEDEDDIDDIDDLFEDDE